MLFSSILSIWSEQANKAVDLFFLMRNKTCSVLLFQSLSLLQIYSILTGRVPPYNWKWTVLSFMQNLEMRIIEWGSCNHTCHAQCAANHPHIHIVLWVTQVCCGSHMFTVCYGSPICSQCAVGHLHVHSVLSVIHMLTVCCRSPTCSQCAVGHLHVHSVL